MRFYGSPPQNDLTYSDVFLVPSHSAVASRLDVSLAPDDRTGSTLPLVSANMNSVTGPRLAATMARRGGLGVLPQDLPVKELGAAIAWVKSQSPIFDSPVELPQSASVAEALRLVPATIGQGISVRDEAGKLLGCLDASRLGGALPTGRVGDLLNQALTAIKLDESGDARALFDLLVERGDHYAPVSRQGQIVGALSRKAALRSTIYSPNLDVNEKLKVAAAMGINGNVAKKAEVLAEYGVDVLVLDTAHGDQEAMLRAIDAVCATGISLPLVAGNVVTASAVESLVNAGASIIKVGVGPGAMCTTRMMTAVGRPQFSAVLECAEAARSLGATVWADGGVRYPRDVALALAAGAASVMIGSWFAGTIEAPGELERDSDGKLYKDSWGMASTKAVQDRFDGLDSYELARKTLFAEGISSSRIYLDPQRPSVEDLIDMISSGVRSSLTYAGASNLAEFHERALVGIQSAAGYEEGKALPVGW